MYVPYNKYFNENTKLNFFIYKDKSYPSGTKLIFTGYCILNQEKVFLSKKVLTFLYCKGSYDYLKDDNNNIYLCQLLDFEMFIRDVIHHEEKSDVKQENTEFYWTDEDVAKTLWYIAIMLFATIFNDNVGIWIFATIVWGYSVFGKKK